MAIIHNLYEFGTVATKKLCTIVCRCMGMDEVETAAADTTSEHSSSPTPLHHAHTYQLGHMTPPNYPSKMTGTSLPLSSDHHGQQPTWEARNTQLGRERDFDDLFEFEDGAPPLKRQRMETIGDQSSQMSPETSVHVRRHHGDRPVGIAQPMQLQDTQQTSSPSLPIPSASKESPLSLLTSKEDIDQLLQKQKLPSHASSTPQLKHSSSSSSSSSISPFHSSAQVQVHSPEQPVATTIPSQQSQSTSGTFGTGDSSDSTGGSGTKVDLIMSQGSRKIPLNYLDEVYDSDQSQESQRFDKFINESSNKSSGSSSTERLTLSDKKQHFESLQESTASSETSSESTTQFIATYVIPNMKYLDSDACIESSTNQSDAKSILDSPSHQHNLPPPPPVETPPGMRVSKEPFDPHAPLPWIGSGSDEEERHGHLPVYSGVEKDYSAATSRRRSLSHLPTTRPIESE